MKPILIRSAVFICLVLFCSSLLSGADYIEWVGNFDAINLTTMDMQDSQPSGSSTINLLTSVHVSISADNAAQLDNGTDNLVTEYKLTFDDAGGTTGVDTPDWELYDAFLTIGNEGDVTYVADDNEVEVTFYARASNPAGRVADAGSYSTTQTLTASWAGDP